MTRRTLILSVAAAVAAALALARCGPPAVCLKDTAKSYRSQDYERVFESWTRHGEVYNLDSLENSLKVSATFLSWEMRQAYVARYAYDYGLDGAEKTRMLDEERKKLEERNEFVVAATATDQKWAQFQRQDTPWQITLLTSDGSETHPSELKRIPKPAPALRAYFSFITTYREVFRFYFPIVDEASGEPYIKPDLTSFSLVFAGALGRVELKWKVKDEEAQR